MRDGKLIIDFHAHVEYVNPTKRMSPVEFVRFMDEAGIDRSVILGGDQADSGSRPVWSDPEEIVLPTNFDDDSVAAFCSQYPNRLIGFASVHPDRHRPERKVRRAIEDLGLRGVKLYPHAGFYPHDRRLDLVYEICSELGVPVMIHTGIKAVRWQMLKYNNPVYVDEVATRFPRLQIVMCHGGFPWCDEFLVVAHSNPNIWVDITFLDYIESTFKTPGFTEQTVKDLYRVIGPDRMLWGTEGPVMHLPLFGSHGPENYAKCIDFFVQRFGCLSEEDKAAILGGNAQRLLGLS